MDCSKPLSFGVICCAAGDNEYTLMSLIPEMTHSHQCIQVQQDKCVLRHILTPNVVQCFYSVICICISNSH